MYLEQQSPDEVPVFVRVLSKALQDLLQLFSVNLCDLWKGGAGSEMISKIEQFHFMKFSHHHTLFYKMCFILIVTCPGSKSLTHLLFLLLS